MIWLQCWETHNLLAEYHHHDGSRDVVTRNSLVGQGAPETDGSYSGSGNVFLALYRFDGTLYLRAGERLYDFQDELTISNTGRGSSRQLVIIHKGTEAYRVEYDVTLENFIANDPTPFIDDEDFDYGLFLRNVSRSDRRKRALLYGGDNDLSEPDSVQPT